VLAYRRRDVVEAIRAGEDAHARPLPPRTPLEAALAALPGACRDVFVLADVEGLPSDEVGALLGLSRAEVKDLLHGARQLVRGTLPPADQRSEPAGAERRAFPRHRVEGSYPARIRPRPGTWACAALPEDISPGGVRIRAAHPQRIGRLLDLELDTPRLPGGRRYTFRLIRCVPTGDGYHLAGSFLTPMPEADLAALAVPAPPDR
jgi:hypothetical protein